jgi:NAD(P)-dependent dehydrogenase (short-subunit alcohol dehydrogenase family)
MDMYTDAQIGARLAPLFNLTGKTAVVTGGAQGLGLDTSTLLAELGANVVVADLRLEAATEAAAEITSKGGSALAAEVDVGSLDSIQALFSLVEQKFGGTDILVNSAADRTKAELFEMTEAQWDRMLDVSLRGTFYCAREAIKGMKAKGQGGAIVNISSAGAVRTTIWGINVHYDAAKAGVDSLTRSFAGEFGADNIRVNSILPGGMLSKGGANVSASYNIRGPIMLPGRIPLGRMGSTMEIAQAVVFLVSPASSYITGQIIAVDGGYFVS